MIRALSSPPFAQGCCGAKLCALYDCYADIPSLASFYEGESFCCALFGGRLTVCGSPEAEELAAFAAFLSVREIEGEALPDLPVWKREEFPLLRFAGEGKPVPLKETEDLSSAYAVLCESDEAFRAGTDRLLWISDLRRRIGRGRGAVYLRGGACAVITAKNEDEAVLGAVACRPADRGKGTAASLVRDLSQKLRFEGLFPVTAAASGSLCAYYRRLNYRETGSLTVLTIQESP